MHGKGFLFLGVFTANVSNVTHSVRLSTAIQLKSFIISLPVLTLIDRYIFAIFTACYRIIVSDK